MHSTLCHLIESQWANIFFYIYKLQVYVEVFIIFGRQRCRHVGLNLLKELPSVQFFRPFLRSAEKLNEKGWFRGNLREYLPKLQRWKIFLRICAIFQFVGSPVSCVPLSNQPSGPLARELIVPLNHYNPTVIFMLYKMHYLSILSKKTWSRYTIHNPCSFLHMLQNSVIS